MLAWRLRAGLNLVSLWLRLLHLLVEVVELLLDLAAALGFRVALALGQRGARFAL